MNLPFYLIIALLLVALAVIVTVVVVRSRYGARLLRCRHEGAPPG